MGCRKFRIVEESVGISAVEVVKPSQQTVPADGSGLVNFWNNDPVVAVV
ncbi:MAG: hypothetical protein KDN22_11260 [Verrucomicrobiae bacterium]|nr:hypothetical protein [Verrucomicrobiae bacterium]